MRLSRWRRATVTSVVILAASTPAAAAQDLGVQVDPDSPAGTEYALPVEHANRVAGTPSKPAPGRAADGATQRPLFGEGVTPPPARAKRRRGGSDSPASASAGSARAARPSLASSAPEPSGSALPWLLGSGALVVLVGVGLSRALQRVARLT